MGLQNLILDRLCVRQLFHSHKTSVSTLGLEHFIKNKRKQERTLEVIADLH